MRKLIWIGMFAASLFLGAGSAMADSVDFSLVQANLTGTQGSTLTWQYDVSNTSGQTIYDLYVNADVWQYGIPDASVFDAFGSGIVTGTSLIGTLYSFTADPAVTNSFNSGTFDLTILLADGSTEDLFANYSATISPAAVVGTPEPSILFLLLAGMSALASALFLQKLRN